MADSHPYISGPGNIAQMIAQLRNSFPTTVTSETVKRLGNASNNESYVINALQFVGIISSEGKKTDKAAQVFSHHKDEEFASEFKNLVSTAYSDLIELHGEKAWTLDDDTLITFFRRADQTSATIGKRQAGTFKIFSALSGHGELPSSRNSRPKSEKIPPKKIETKKKGSKSTTSYTGTQEPAVNIPEQNNRKNDFGLSVRVEINLPADGSKETYDNIFKSIKENLLNG